MRMNASMNVLASEFQKWSAGVPEPMRRAFLKLSVGSQDQQIETSNLIHTFAEVQGWPWLLMIPCISRELSEHSTSSQTQLERVIILLFSLDSVAGGSGSSTYRSPPADVL